MSYKYSKGAQVIGDLKAADDTQRNTQIDFEEDYIGFETSGSAVMVVSGSKVGIGTTTPGTNLHVKGDDARIRIDGDTNSHPGVELSENGTRKWIVYNDYTNDNLSFKTDSNVRMSIEQAGNVGIGTTSPDEKLHIEGNLKVVGDTPEVTVRRDNNADASTIQFQGSGGVVGAYVKFLGDESGAGGTNNDLALGTGASVTERIRIRGDGNVGIGTTSPVATLTVNGSVASKITSISNSNSPYSITATDHIILADSFGGAITINLPACSSNSGRIIIVKDVGAAAGSNNITISRNGSDQIDGSNSIAINTNRGYVQLVSDGSQFWHQIAKEGVS